MEKGTVKWSKGYLDGGKGLEVRKELELRKELEMRKELELRKEQWTYS
jgi:hypothetical protein